jgi:hypothetical protein
LSRLGLIIPVAKAHCTDIGNEVASLGIQVHGGMGYVEETGAAQYFRDARITPIYEGTNGIQAADLVNRKIAVDNGATLSALLDEIKAEVDDENLLELVAICRSSAKRMLDGPVESRLAGSYPYLTMLGVTIAGWLLDRQRRRIASASSEDQMKQAAVEYYLSRIAPEAAGLEAAIQPTVMMMTLCEDAFAA